MPFVAPLIVSAIGLTGVAAAVGTAIVSTALSVGLSYAASKLLAPKPDKSSSAAERGTQLSLSLDSNKPRQLAFGKTATAGSLTYWQFADANNNNLEMVIDLCDWPCGKLTGIFVGGKRETFANVNNYLLDGESATVGSYGSVFSVRYHSGSFAQAANTTLIANSGGAWTSTDRKRGVAYVVVSLTYSPEKFPNNIPNMVFEFEGCLMYDFRKDSTIGGSGAHRWNDITTWETTSNPAVIAYNWRRGLWYNSQKLYGMSATVASLVLSSYTSAANICDQIVTKADTTTEKRYTISMMVDTSKDNKSILNSILLSCAGYEVPSGGYFKFNAGASQTVIADLTDDDIDANAEFTYTGKRSGGDLINAVFGSYVNPTTSYQTSSLPPRISSADETTDRERKSVTISYDMVTSPTQAQRLMEITRKAARKQGVCTCTLRAKASIVEPGDWITLTVASRGWVNKTFQIKQCGISRDQRVPVELIEMDSSVFVFTNGTDEIATATPGTVDNSAPALDALVALVGTAITVNVVGTSQLRPGIQATWQSFTDYSVVNILIEYRLVGGGGSALSKTVTDLSTNSYSWVDGIQSDAQYEIRARPVTLPARPTNWTGWVSVSSLTATQIINIGTGSVVPLSPQTEFEISLITRRDDIIDSRNAHIDELWGDLAHVASLSQDAVARAYMEVDNRRAAIYQEQIVRISEDEVLASQIDTLFARADTTEALIATEQTARISQDGVIATSLSTLSTRVDGNDISISQNATSINGVKAMWTMNVQSGNRVLGGIKLDGTAAGTALSFLSNSFTWYHPTVNSGTPAAILDISVVGGAPTFVFNGTMMANSVTAGLLTVGQLVAANADLGSATVSGVWTSSNGKMQQNWITGALEIYA